MAAIKKALRTSIRRTRYSMFEQKENDYIHTPTLKRVVSEERDRGESSECQSASCSSSGPISRRHSAVFRRGSQMTRSVRDAVGTIRQRLRMSTRRLRPLQENVSPAKSQLGRQTPRRKDVSLYSPFHIETPGQLASGRVSRRSNIRTVVNMETPTRLKREVEALTANMEALAALTPNTLQSRRKSHEGRRPITNGSLKTPLSARRRIVNSPILT